MGVRRHLPVVLPVGVLLLFAPTAGAHGFGQRYDLPIPLSFYLWGAGATVVLSFVILALFLKADRAARPLPTITVPWFPANTCAITFLVRALGVIGFLAVIAAGFLGDQNPMRNLAPVMIWIIGWVGLSFFSAVLGPIWRILNPWTTLFRCFKWASLLIRGSDQGAHKRRLPLWLGVWPAFVLFLIFAWMELVWSGRNVPTDLAAALAIYSAMTWTGMALYGQETWLRSAEVFEQVFGIFARFAPLNAGRQTLEIRAPASGLVEDKPASASMVALVIAVLATVTFDGFLETPLWARVDLAILESPLESFLWTVLDLREDQALRIMRTLALPAAVLLLAATYFLVCWWMAVLSKDSSTTTGFLARRFVFTLVPISLAYHIAHYFSYLLVGGQYAIPLLSDPFGLGWNLFATASYQVNIGVVDPRLQWYVAVISIVLGHVIAVYLAHVTALRIFAQARSALVTQIPILLLMVGYTMCSLWILSQPIVETAG